MKRAPLPARLFTVLLPLFCAFSPAGGDGGDAFPEAMHAMETRIGGRIGVMALDTESGRTLAFRSDERFAMASTFKPLLAAAVLEAADAGRLSLADPVALAEAELQPYSPVVERANRPAMTLGELCEAAITVGDNTATNLLLERVGGPAGLTRFLRRHGDDITRLDRYEIELNENAPGDERDTTTPGAMVTSLARLLFGTSLAEGSRTQLADWLVASRTGARRLRAGLPGSWRVGDKTGTGENGAVNDVAVAWPPGRGPILVAVFQSGSTADREVLDAVHADVATLVAGHFAQPR